MNILICEQIGITNEYIYNLMNAYQKKGHHVILGIQNFLYSNFLPDFVHIQWPEALYRWSNPLPKSQETSNIIKKRLDYYSQKGIPIVYTIHNLLPHENVTGFDKEIFKLIFDYADICVHHGSKSISQLIEFYGDLEGKKHIVCPHGPYQYFTMNSQECRKKFQLPPKQYIFLNFGLQRQYKGIGFVNNVFNNWSSKEACLFTIGPRITDDPGIIRKVINSGVKIVEGHFLEIYTRHSHKKRIIFQPVSIKGIPEIMAASDVVFLGHQDGLNSGIISLAATYGKPVIFPDIGNFQEQLSNWSWYESYEVGNINSAIEALNNMMTRIKHLKPGMIKFDNSEWRETNSWDVHVTRIIQEIKFMKEHKQ